MGGRTSQARRHSRVAHLEELAAGRDDLASLVTALARKLGPFTLALEDVPPPGAGFRRVRVGDGVVLSYLSPEDIAAERPAPTRSTAEPTRPTCERGRSRPGRTR